MPLELRCIALETRWKGAGAGDVPAKRTSGILVRLGAG